jgi:PleD family two-component response regulator
LRTNNDLKFTPLFIITKHLNKDYLDKLRIVGADNFFMEPLNQAIIEKEISDALKQKNEEKKLSQIYPLSSQMSDKKTLHEKAIYDKAIFDEVSDTLRKKREFSLLAIEALDIESSKFTEVQISDVMKRALGENGKLIALGHGKYVAFLLQTSNEYALFAAKSLHDILHSILKIKLVIGICSQNKSHYVNIQDMLKDAKTALYNAKNKGVFFEVFS